MKPILIALALIVCACSRKPPPPKNEFEAFERKFVAEMALLAKGLRAEGRTIADQDIPTSYRAVFIGPSGTFVDRKLVVTLAELDAKRADIVAAIDANAKLAPSIGWNPTVTFDLDAEPASIAIAALRLFAGRATIFNTVRRNDPELPQRATDYLCSSTTVRDAPSAATELPQLSILLERERIWIGLSRLLEFQEIPDRQTERDFEKLQVTLREHKASDLFRERVDLELGASGGTAGDVLYAFRIACDVGFPDVAVLPRDQLSAVPQL